MQSLLLDLFYSLSRVLLGVSLAFVLGLLLAYIRSELPEKLRSNIFVTFLFEALRFPPPIAWIPFVILLSGIGMISTLVIVILGAMPPIYLSIYEGISQVKRKHKPLVESMGISSERAFSKIYFPAMIPYVFLGIRNGFGMGWMSIIAAEMIAGDRGLGYSIQLFRLNLQYEMMLLDIFLIGLAGFIFSEGTRWLEKKVAPWTV